MGRTIKFPVVIISGGRVKLKKGDLIAKIDSVERFDNGGVGVSSITEEGHLDFEKLDIGLQDIKEREHLIQILKNYYKNIRLSSVSDAKLLIKHEINLSDNIPTTCNPRPIPHSRRSAIDQQIQHFLESDCIEKSNSLYSAPIVPVVKKDGSIRMCIDYRKLNSKTIIANFPIPRSEDLLDDLKGCKYFSVIDLKSVYHHILIKEEDRPKTAFVTHDEKFHWKVMPFGLSGAAFSLSSAMSSVLKDLKNY